MRSWMRIGALSSGAIVLSMSIGAPRDAGADGASVWFRVVHADGTTVRNPVVMVSVFGPTYPFAEVLTGSPTGEIVVAPPADDPVVAARLQRGEPVNLMIRVFDKPPGSADLNSVYVTVAIGRDATGVVRELSSVTGKTFTMAPGLTAFTPADPATAAILGTRVPVPAGAPECEPTSNGAPRPCRVVDYPEWSRQTMVTVAENHGAGADIVSKLRYNSTVVTKTEVAFQAGSSGFVQVGGGVAYENQTTSGFEFADRGPHENVRAMLESVFLRERAGVCYSEGGQGGPWVCQMETTYRPYEATGTYSQAITRFHDNLIPDWDCWTNMDGAYEPSTQSTSSNWFELRLGPSEDWAAGTQGGLYANTTITQQTFTRLGHVRRWEVAANPAYEHQYMYVPGGKFTYDPNNADEAACVRSRLGRALTESTDYNFNPAVLHAPDDIPAPPQPDPPNESEPGRAFCGRMPDKCD